MDNKLLEKKLCDLPNTELIFDATAIRKSFDYANEYKRFLDKSKTERETVKQLTKALVEVGYNEFKFGQKFKVGDKIYFNNRNECLVTVSIGSQPMSCGANIIASHIDSPKIDLKQKPLFEKNDISFFKTHYYGYIKEYQWLTIPLSIYGTVIREDGSLVELCIGESEDDQVFTFTDLLPHLSNNPSVPGVTGEELNAICGSLPYMSDVNGDSSVKLNVLNTLYNEYHFTERDLIGSDLVLVPSGKCRDVGFDRSLIGGYGHDDKSSVYASLKSSLVNNQQERTFICIYANKEETGSSGNTSINSSSITYFLSEVLNCFDVGFNRFMHMSECLSADVTAALDPTFPNPMDISNSSFLHHGPVIARYCGYGGKNDTNESSAEFTNKIKTQINHAQIPWQIAELGKVGTGGGGTLSKYIGSFGCDVIDVGAPVLSMHSPFEIVSKLDIYNLYRVFNTFFEACGT